MTPSITCPLCGMTSYHPKDVEHRYCGNCNAFHIDAGAIALHIDEAYRLPQVRAEQMREFILKAAGVWEASNAGRSPPDNVAMRALAARYGFSYDWLMGRKATPEV